MNSTMYPMQARNELTPGQPAGPAQVENLQKAKDYIVWSIFNLFHCNPFCLGLVALFFSVKARDLKMVGDVEGARAEGKKALNANIIATVIVSLTVVILIIVFIILGR